MTQVVEMKLPQTVDDVNESVVVLWYKSEGEFVEEHDVLVEVQSEKATFEIEAPASGILQQIRVARAQVAAVGDVLAIIKTDANPSADVRPPNDAGAKESSITGGGAGSAHEGSSREFVSAAPRIRRLALQLGVDLTSVQGTGPNGRITETDVQQAAQVFTEMSALGHHSFDSAKSMSGVRKTIAKRMQQSLQQSAQLTLTRWADVTQIAHLRSTSHRAVTWNTWVIMAVVMSLKRHPDLNAILVDESIQQFDSVHLGIAVDTDAGLMVPVIRDADKKSLAAIQAEAGELVNRVRNRKATSADLSGSTFTLTNLGAYGIEFFTPIINPPEAGILGVGQIDHKVVIQDHSWSVVQRLPLSLTFDHRVTDGAPAARFLATVTEYLANPRSLL